VSLVMVVEDDRDIRETLGFFLEDSGHDVVTAPHGQEALRLLRAGVRPNVIILDLMMPVMSGWELREQMLRDPAIASIPTIVITGDKKSSQCAEGLHAVALLAKPFEPDALLALVRDAGLARPP
jgi:CheY-like chemotaxis protein